MRLSDSIWQDSLMPLPLCVMVSENDSSQKCLRSKQRRLVLFVSVFLFFYLQISLCVRDLKKKKKILAGPKSNSLIINLHPSDALGDAIMQKTSLLFVTG